MYLLLVLLKLCEAIVRYCTNYSVVCNSTDGLFLSSEYVHTYVAMTSSNIVNIHNTVHTDVPIWCTHTISL